MDADNVVSPRLQFRSNIFSHTGKVACVRIDTELFRPDLLAETADIGAGAHEFRIHGLNGKPRCKAFRKAYGLLNGIIKELLCLVIAFIAELIITGDMDDADPEFLSQRDRPPDDLLRFFPYGSIFAPERKATVCSKRHGKDPDRCPLQCLFQRSRKRRVIQASETLICGVDAQFHTVKTGGCGKRKFIVP